MVRLAWGPMRCERVSARTSLVTVLFANACALRVAASENVNLSAAFDVQTERRAALDVDVATDWVALACEDLPRRLVVKAVHGRFVIRGLPAGRCEAWVGGQFGCAGELEPGRTTYMRNDRFPHFVASWSVPRTCEFLSPEDMARPPVVEHGFTLEPLDLTHLHVRELYWEHILDPVDWSATTGEVGSAPLRW